MRKDILGMEFSPEGLSNPNYGDKGPSKHKLALFA